MPWNGRSRLFEHARPKAADGWQALRWTPVGLAILVLATGAVPAASSAATPSVSRLANSWSAAKVQESSSQIDYSGGWRRAAHPDYLGGNAKAATHAGARARLAFRGSAVAWVGPTGPPRPGERVHRRIARRDGEHESQLVPRQARPVPEDLGIRRAAPDRGRRVGHGRPPDGRRRRVPRARAAVRIELRWVRQVRWLRADGPRQLDPGPADGAR